MKFIASTLASSSLLVQSIAKYCAMFGRYISFLGTTTLLCWDQYINYPSYELTSNHEHIKYFSFKCWHFNGASDIQKIGAGSLSDLIAVRDGQLFLPPRFFSSQQLGDIIYLLFVYIMIHNIYTLWRFVKNLCEWLGGRPNIRCILKKRSYLLHASSSFT